jgi:hypothetical protein
VLLVQYLTDPGVEEALTATVPRLPEDVRREWPGVFAPRSAATRRKAGRW